MGWIRGDSKAGRPPRIIDEREGDACKYLAIDLGRPKVANLCREPAFNPPHMGRARKYDELLIWGHRRSPRDLTLLIKTPDDPRRHAGKI